jgi:cell wall-associated NlpC family hydrolase
VAKAITRRLRPLLAVVALGTVALVAPSTAVATPDTHPSIADVQRQLGELALQNTQLVEQFDQAQGDVQAKQAAADRAEAAAAKANTAFESARSELSMAATAIYEGGSFSATGALLSSDSGNNYLDQLQTLSMLSSHTSQIVRGLQVVQREAVTAQSSADELLGVAKAKRDELAKKRTVLQKQITKYQNLLGTLTAAQRAAYQRQMNPSVSSAAVAQLRSGSVHATSAAAAQAVKFALAQVGKPYVYGAAGPGSYDCSGLTMAAWASAGVSLPHSAAEQYNYGHHVSFNDLQPGDLLFFYSPIGHVTIYAGDGLMVSAPETGQNVSVIPANAFGSNFVGATRLTG